MEHLDATADESCDGPPTLTKAVTPQKNLDELPKSNVDVSPSFLDHVVWPTESPQKSLKRKKTERLLHAATSRKWLSYWEDKQKSKEEKEETKRKRLLARKQKQDLKEKNQMSARKKRRGKKANSSSDT